jgi:23S rRNA (cytosine1962-C5)-methyltransferase
MPATPSYTLDYQLLDFGGGRKLERFGAVLTNRPEVLATKGRHLSANEWLGAGTSRFEENSKQQGTWFPPLPASWHVAFACGDVSWKAICKPGIFKHLGLFPEQAQHWALLTTLLQPGHRFLNLFGYTGASSLTAALCGADVYHVDASKSVVNWAAENARLNGVERIHWICDDALAFARREERRGHKYHGIIMDPPIFGRGKNGVLWKLEHMLPDLLGTVRKILHPGGFLILNTYSPTLSLADMQAHCEKNGFRQNESGWLCVHTAKEHALRLSKYTISQV